MGSSRPRTKDFFAAPTLSLSLVSHADLSSLALKHDHSYSCFNQWMIEFAFRMMMCVQAGAFGRNAPAATSGDEVEKGDEGDRGIRDEHLGKEVEISSENTGPGSQSGDGEEEDRYDGGSRKKRSRKSYHRHTAEQAIQERHENSLLKSELENLHKENRAMREQTKRPLHCANCGVAAGSSGDFDAAASNKEQQLHLENARLRAEVEKLQGKLGKAAANGAISPASPPFCAGTIQTKDNRSPLEVYGGGLTGRDKKSILELVGRALEELKTMSSSGEPLWVRSVETGRDILNYDEYVRLFRRDDDDAGDQDLRGAWSVEASREGGVVYLDTMQLVHAFMDVNQWKELFPSMITKASTLDVIRSGESDDHDGVVQLMFAEVQTLTPMVPTRELCFARYCKKLAPEKWAIVDASFDKAGGGADASSPVITSWKNASGCIIEEQTNGHSRVTWVEHAKHREPAAVPSAFRAVTASGLAFGARRWLATLRLQCERMVFSVATNVPTRDSNGVSTLAGRRSVLKLAHRMTSSICRVIGGSRDLAWSRAPRAGAGDVRLTSRRNADDPGEPQGLIACAVLSAWLPVSPTALLDFLKDESRRPEWDVTLHGRSVRSRVSVAKGKDRGNCVTAYAPTSAEEQSGGVWIVQDVCTNSCESIVAYAPVDAAVLQPVISGHDSSGVPVLPCGVAIMPDGLESRPAVIMSRKEDGAAGSLVTVAFQVLASSSTMAALSPETAETVTSLVSCTLRDIRKALGCQDR
ncbi:hypothetical protein ACQ4PT_063211 [Festuca glaucescens]